MLIWAIVRGIDADDVGSPRWPYSRKAFSKMPGKCMILSLPYVFSGQLWLTRIVIIPCKSFFVITLSFCVLGV